MKAYPSHRYCDGIIVLDNGASTLKIGYAGEKTPRKICPNCVAQTRKGSGVNKHFLGENVSLCFGECFVNRPHSHGLLTDLEIQRTTWRQVLTSKTSNLDFSSLHPNNVGVVLTEHYNVPLHSHLQIHEILFEEFDIGGCVVNQGELMVPSLFPQSLKQRFSPDTAVKIRYPCATGSNTAEVIECFKEEYLHDPFAIEGTSTSSISDMQPMKFGMLGDDGTFGETTQNRAESPCRLILDMSYSGAFAVPIFRGYPLESAALHNTSGGAFLNSALSQLINFRHTHLTGNELIVEQLKESACYVSLDFLNELRRLAETKKAFNQNLRLQNTPPNVSVAESLSATQGVEKLFFAPIRREKDKSSKPIGGTVESVDMTERGMGDDVIILSTERIGVPELLFHPDDMLGESHCLPSHMAAQAIGAIPPNTVSSASAASSVPKVPFRRPAGVAEMVSSCILRCPRYMQAAMCSSIIVTGGCSEFPNFLLRLYAELRQQLPLEFPVRLHWLVNSPSISTWAAGSLWGATPDNFDQCAYTREAYFERGSPALRKRHGK